MKDTMLSPKKFFLYFGLALILIGVSLTMFEFYFLSFFYGFPGILTTYFYYAYSIILLEDQIVYRNFWFQRKAIRWTDIAAVRGTFQKSIVIRYTQGQVTIIDVFKDRREILDHIIKHVDKTVVSGQLMDEWSQFFTLFNDDFKEN
jgi:hypothetical protein